MMYFFSEKQKRQLLINGSGVNPGRDNIPVSLLTLTGTDQKWLINELYQNRPNIALGLFFNKNDFEIGEITLDVISKLKGPNLSSEYKGNLFTTTEISSPIVTFDVAFVGKYPLSIYREVARELGRIETDTSTNLSIWEKYLNRYEVPRNR
ncbi:MAG: DUF2958 domain-containing protein [Bacteroidetes bacterium]|nr:DUF2958 domain-containing protein [Bacteroidota bacterium]